MYTCEQPRPRQSHDSFISLTADPTCKHWQFQAWASSGIAQVKFWSIVVIAYVQAGVNLMQAMESEKEVDRKDWDPAGIQLVGTFFPPLQSLHQVINNCELLRLYHPHQLHCNNSVAYSKIREDNGGRGPVSGGVSMHYFVYLRHTTFHTSSLVVSVLQEMRISQHAAREPKTCPLKTPLSAL